MTTAGGGICSCPGELRAVAAATIEALDGSSRLVVELSKAGGEVVVVAVGVAAPERGRARGRPGRDQSS